MTTRTMTDSNAAEDLEPSWVENITAWGVASRGVTLLIDPYITSWDKLAAIDVETDEADNFVGIGITWGNQSVVYFTTLNPNVREILSSCKLIGHNIKSDAQWLRKWGVNIRPEQLVYDTMMASYVQDSSKQSHALKDLAKDVLGYEYPAYKEIVGTGKSKQTLDKQPVELTANYCGMDVLSTYKLYHYFQKTLTEAQLQYLSEIELPTMWALMLMEERGVQIDAAYLRTLDTRFNLEINRLVEGIKLRAPSIENVNSDRQVASFLSAKGFELPKTEKGKDSVSAKALEPYSGVPFVKALRRYSELEKLVSTYTKPLIERSNGEESYRLHANFNQAVTDTGRLSSSKPNLQNIPARTSTGNLVRRAFITSPGRVLIDADYSQIEPRLFAHFSQDPELLKIFLSGHDLYDSVAETIGSTRAVAKTVWLALTYNAGAFKISQTAKIPFYQATSFVEAMKRKFKTAFAWKESVIRQAECDGYVTTMFGARRKVDHAGLGPNYMVQGSAAEIMKKALIATSEFLPVLTVHDELLFEVSGDSVHIDDSHNCIPHLVEAIKLRMESVIKLSVPLIVEVGVGRSWAEAKP